jgi:ABC-type spermidine/putrescine transport system permease subunit I
VAATDQTGDRVGQRTLNGSVPILERLQRWRRRNGSSLLLAAPLLIYMALVFAVPIILQIAFAFYTRELYKGVLWRAVPKFTLENFGRAFNGQEPYLQSIIWTVGIAFLTSAMSITFALPVAYFLARYNPRGKSIIELSFLLPIFGDIFTLFAIAYSLAPQGPVNWLLMGLGLIREPISFIGGTPVGVIVWMSVPTLAVLLIRSALVGVDVMYEEAAQTMGANALQTFLKITLPLAKRGIMGALLLSVSAAVGVYTVPLVLVGPYNPWLSNKIFREYTPFGNYPMASALGVILTLVSFLFLFLYLRTQEVGDKS